MKIFSAEQIKAWDTFTIQQEPVSSINLMERAADKCFEWIKKSGFEKKSFIIFCGKGNNGGDGLAIARLLLNENYKAKVYILETGKQGSQDLEINFGRLQSLTKEIYFIKSLADFPPISENEIIIECLFGTGLNKPVEGIGKSLIEFINASKAKIISIDVPGGLYVDKSSKENTVTQANYTLTFQHYKLAFFMAENEKFFGEIILLDIGLHPDFLKTGRTNIELIDEEIIKSIYKRRDAFSHKGAFGNAAIISGSIGFMGAAVLAVKACLRSGAGKVTGIIPKVGYEILQISAPEAMAKIAGETYLEQVQDLEKFNAIGIGPGIGIYDSHYALLKTIFTQYNKPIVLDADALNIISRHKELFHLIPAESIITPHPVEFERLFGKTNNDFETADLAMEKSKEFNIYIILKGHYTLIATPQGNKFFNSTGNPGMATGGSGDVLTGIITGLLAQKYSSLQACQLGVYLHGLAGDIAAEKFSAEAMIAVDIIDCLGKGFKKIKGYKYPYKIF